MICIWALAKLVPQNFPGVQQSVIPAVRPLSTLTQFRVPCPKHCRCRVRPLSSGVYIPFTWTVFESMSEK
jgi:hypothetical protein